MNYVVIVGCGFVGLNAAKVLAGKKNIRVKIIDRNNYHLFQPLLYQVTTAGLSPAEIAVPIRNIFSKYKNVRVVKGEVTSIDLKKKAIQTDIGELGYDYLVLACGVRPSYFGNEKWEQFAPGLKTIEQATEIRRRILTAFEKAETDDDSKRKAQLLTFIVIGGGSTGVELAGAIGELSRYTLLKDFKNIDPALARIILIEAGPQILPYFSEKLSVRATRDLESLGVQVKTFSQVTNIDTDSVQIGKEKIYASTIIWAAGVKASDLNKQLGVELDVMGRIIVEPDLSLKKNPEVFVAGDQAHFSYQTGIPLPGIAPVALQQGKFIAKNILREIKGQQRVTFKYFDKGQMATIGRRKAILQIGKVQLSGLIAWLVWLFIHIYYLMGFKNRVFVLFQWAYSYVTFKKGARLIVNKSWRFYKSGGNTSNKF
ncbi:MAG: NAD(P)/FAD-dependent oxidoreductase [Desulfobacteraceae bacterium]|jgi:NADH dehydrogenase|nr:NAD(P)/FAD-dependent oxidoreductase [Desulfobacteraceae bacterium]